MSTATDKVKIWSRKDRLKQLYSADEVPNLFEIADMIDNIRIGKENITFQTIRAKALIAFNYLTACRISEPLPDTKLGYDGVKKKDIEFSKYKGYNCMFIRILNRKHRSRKSKRQPIPIDKEYKIVLFIKRYLDTLEDDQVLFNLSKQRVIQIINTTTGFNSHFLRHIRLTHLITLYDFKEQALVKFAGWTTSAPAQHYAELSPKAILQEFYK